MNNLLIFNMAPYVHSNNKVPNTSTLEESDGSMIITLHWIFIFDIVVHPVSF